MLYYDDNLDSETLFSVDIVFMVMVFPLNDLPIDGPPNAYNLQLYAQMLTVQCWYLMRILNISLKLALYFPNL